MPDKGIKKVTESDLLKKAMIKALEKSLGIATTACIKVGITRQTHYRWIKEDSSYKEAVDSIIDIALDFTESMLLKKIKSGDTTAIIFHLKTKGKKRGYIEKSQLEVEMPEYTGLFTGVRRPEKPVDNVISN